MWELTFPYVDEENHHGRRYGFQFIQSNVAAVEYLLIVYNRSNTVLPVIQKSTAIGEPLE